MPMRQRANVYQYMLMKMETCLKLCTITVITVINHKINVLTSPEVGSPLSYKKTTSHGIMPMPARISVDARGFSSKVWSCQWGLSCRNVHVDSSCLLQLAKGCRLALIRSLCEFFARAFGLYTFWVKGHPQSLALIILYLKQVASKMAALVRGLRRLAVMPSLRATVVASYSANPTGKNVFLISAYHVCFLFFRGNHSYRL